MTPALRPTGRPTAGWSAGAPAGPAAAPPLRRLRPLLDPELWCLGRDVRHPDGNALLRYGFERVRPPAGEAGSSAYVLPLAGGGHCVLWGFACACVVPSLGGALVLRRHPFSARLADPAALRLPLWRGEQLPGGGVPATAEAARLALRLAAAAAGALAAYERWALATLGVEHRRQCDAERPRAVRRRQAVPGEALAASWEAFAARAAAWPAVPAPALASS